MIRDLLLAINDDPLSKKAIEARICGVYNRIGLLMHNERCRTEDKLAETSCEENGWSLTPFDYSGMFEEGDQESSDFPDHLKVVETRCTGSQIRGGDLTIEVGRQNPDSVFSGMERAEADWEQFYTADGMPKPYYLRKKP